MNWGGFAGGFATGFTGGVSMGKALSEALKQKKIEDIRADAMNEAKVLRDKAVDGAIQEAKAPPAATGGITGKPAEEVTAGSTQPTESVIPNPEKAAGATVTPITSPTDSPDAASAKTASSGMVNVSDNSKPDAAKGVLYVAGKPGSNSTKGMVEMGNIDLNNRPTVKNPDGSVSTVRSMSINVDGKEVLIPTVVGGKVVSDKEAIDHFRKTGEHLGMFDSVDAANAYADVLHKQQEQSYAPTTAKAQGKAPTNPAASGLPFVVNGKGYATREEARAAAEKATPDMMTFIGKTMVPRMQQAYMEQGDIEKADAWGKWAEDKNNQAAMKEWAGAYRASQMGDIDKAADHIFNLYKRYDDGITPVSKETVKDKEGNITGFNVKLKVDATGEERTQFIDRKSLTEMGLSALSPQAMFEVQFKRQAEADKQVAAVAADNAKSNRDFKEKVVLQDRKHEQDLERDTIKEERDRVKPGTVGKEIEDMRKSGIFTDDEIKARVRNSNSDVGKAPHPDTIRLQVYNKLAESNNAFTKYEYVGPDGKKVSAKFADLPDAEKRKIVDKQTELVMSMSRGGGQPTAPAAGLPQPNAAPAGKKGGVPVFDTKTGQIIYR